MGDCLIIEEMQKPKNRKYTKDSYQFFLNVEADREARFVIFRRRTRIAFMSSTAINISAAMILIFNISVPLYVFKILNFQLHRRSQMVFITIVLKLFKKTMEKG